MLCKCKFLLKDDNTTLNFLNSIIDLSERADEIMLKIVMYYYVILFNKMMQLTQLILIHNKHSECKEINDDIIINKLFLHLTMNLETSLIFNKEIFKLFF